ncbi:MAG TPA: DHA2 family efflux MFS transporter permease subunit, partial [Vicinamibacterales bacterium]|nr:DHA2 family efflux MFS transporter permease subunit [Vicinamibacterales bacterium]
MAIAVMFATFMEVLDTTVVNVSLPHIASSMAATTEEATWAVTSYLVANAIILPMTGWLASRFGRKRLLMMSTAGFTVASFLCGAAPNLASLVIFRIIQGATGGALQPLSQAVLLESFKPEERGRAMGFWGLGIVVAPILGPVVGGWLTENYTWRWVFYINLPFGIISLLMCQRFIFDPPYLKRESKGIDYWGMGLLVVGIGALQYVLDKGQQDDWFASTTIAVLAVIAVVTLVALVIHQLSTSNPIIDLRVFRDRSYATGVFLMTVLGFVLYGSLVLIPVMLQTLFGYPSLEAGEAMAP